MEEKKKEEEEMQIIGEEKEAKSINGTVHVVKQINPTQFKIGPIAGKYTPYIGNGLAK